MGSERSLTARKFSECQRNSFKELKVWKLMKDDYKYAKAHNNVDTIQFSQTILPKRNLTRSEIFKTYHGFIV